MKGDLYLAPLRSKGEGTEASHLDLYNEDESMCIIMALILANKTLYIYIFFIFKKELIEKESKEKFRLMAKGCFINTLILAQILMYLTFQNEFKSLP